jgi:nitrite reductase/ring-hydroxylating ferredoxin subunit
MSNDWVRIGADSEFSETIKLVEIGKNKIAVARLQGELFAFDGLCPHVAGPMHRAEVEGTIVTCPFHAWRFDLKQGGREIHDYRPLSVYQVKVDEGQVHVKLSEPAGT